jgi:hypothetical protein
MLANYTELQQEIADTLHRDDLTSKIPTFIKLFERRANRTLRIAQQEIRTTLTLLNNTNSVALPSNFLEPITLTVMLNNYPFTLDALNSMDFDSLPSVISQPIYYYINNDTIYVDCIAQQDYTLNLHYLKRLDLETEGTNWLLTNNPDVYLYGSLAAASIFIGEDARIPLWGQLAAAGIDEVNEVAHRTRNKPSLRTEYAALSRSNYNINIDF